MSKQWPLVKLGDVLTATSREETVDASKTYRLLGIRLDGQGPFLRETVTGTQTSANKLFRVATGDFIYSRLFAWRGAFGVIDASLDGCYVSSEFPAFTADPKRLDAEYLKYWFRLRPVIKRVEADCTGSTPLTRNRYKESFFLALEIPLPPLAEQRRLVARIEALAGLIAEAQALRKEAVMEAEALFVQARAKTLDAASRKGTQALADCAVLERGKFSHRPRNEPRFFGGNHPWIQIAEIEATGRHIKKWSVTLNDDGLAVSKKFPAGTLLVSIAATIGAVGILDFACCIPDSIVGVTPKEGTESDFLYHYLGYVRTHLESIAPQSAQKNVNLEILGPLPVPRLQIEEQRRIVRELDALQAEVEGLKRLQAETQAELDALLPAVLEGVFNANQAKAYPELDVELGMAAEPIRSKK